MVVLILHQLVALLINYWTSIPRCRISAEEAGRISEVNEESLAHATNTISNEVLLPDTGSCRRCICVPMLAAIQISNLLITIILVASENLEKVSPRRPRFEVGLIDRHRTELPQ